MQGSSARVSKMSNGVQEALKECSARQGLSRIKRANMVDCFATINLSFGRGRIQVHKVSLSHGTDSASEVPEGGQYIQ